MGFSDNDKNIFSIGVWCAVLFCVWKRSWLLWFKFVIIVENIVGKGKEGDVEEVRGEVSEEGDFFLWKEVSIFCVFSEVL